MKNDFRLFTCLNCETIFCDSLPKENSLDYDAYYSEDNLQVPQFVRNRIREVLKGFERCRKTNNLLDVGFGAGTILEVATELKWNAFGVEVSKPAFEKASKAGFNVFHGELESADYEDNFFDVVTFTEILEHVTDPQTVLKQINRVLRPGGLLWLTTPSAVGISSRLLKVDWSVFSPPEHLQIFSLKGMRILLAEAGFSSVKIRTHGVNPFEIVNFFFSKNQDFDRVQTGYSLNRSLEASPAKKTIKLLMNSTLDFLRLGDSIKVYAEK